jgi:hypothetical protein
MEVDFDKPVSTAILWITMETFSQSEKSSRIVGQSFFPLFIDKRNGMPATTDVKGSTNIIPHVGNYQMPVYHARVKEIKPFTYEKFIYNEKIPGTSLLIRLLRVPKRENKKPGEDSVRVKAPTYADGVYSTKYFTTFEEETIAMKLRRKRFNPPLMNILV